MLSLKQVVSIQSHVSYGYVGNRAAVFPLQRLGIDVSAVNTVQFSNHTGYGAWRGSIHSREHIQELLLGLDEVGALESVDGILSGYMGDVHLGRVIYEFVKAQKQCHPDLFYCCDPVIGDIGRGVFVKPGVGEFFRDELISLADLITPNVFELEFLSGCKVNSLFDILAACDQLRCRPEQAICVTSVQSDDHHVALLMDTNEGSWLVKTPFLSFNIAPNGAGDLTASLLLGRYLMQRSLAKAVQLAAASVYQVFAMTFAEGSRELQLIRAQDQLVEPTVEFELEKIR
ncbi:pyridoxal kinase PdxY [Piscirickettsia litoralis]|uniref:pyridoxal kinase n=1 Tax=Piscirickettsia litoralis TaxID=1891921 RepID=A0ABX2ZYQ3_9GAMM|nr:pyridoxal kinase PdxY [Piscirickettsia litoralis]ODN41702.1 pyridoxal kinase [Piscirickettsia litoralis]